MSGTAKATSPYLNHADGSEAVMRPLYEAKIHANDALNNFILPSEKAPMDVRIAGEVERDRLYHAVINAMDAITRALKAAEANT